MHNKHRELFLFSLNNKVENIDEFHYEILLLVPLETVVETCHQVGPINAPRKLFSDLQCHHLYWHTEIGTVSRVQSKSEYFDIKRL